MRRENYVGVFLWYPTASGGRNLEALCLVPKSKEKEIEKADDTKRTWGKYSSVAVALASYKDNPKDPEENLAVFLPSKPKYYGLNDCTHFSSECLIAGGFVISKTDAGDRARRGAGDLANYLYYSKEVRALCFMASHADARAVVDAGVMQTGDVFAYYEDTKHQYAHHTVVAVSPETVAMHTMHQWDTAWDFDETDDTSERYSLFHFVDDDYTTPDAKRWTGWWKVETHGDPTLAVPMVRYYYFGDTGTLTVTTAQPKVAKTAPNGESYTWFATDSETAVVVRRNNMDTSVETFTRADPKDPQRQDIPATATGTIANLPEGSKKTLKATKLF